MILHHRYNSTNALIKDYPQAIYQGTAFRAIRGEWDHTYKNLSWSKEEHVASQVCHSLTCTIEELQIHLYRANVYGIDIELLIKYMIEDGFRISQNCLSLVLKEKEILAIEFNNLECLL